MDSSFDVPDPSDWLKTPVSRLAAVETALRCQVCKDFFNTPVITSCSHTFCSLCIRRCLTNDSKCPTCRSDDQELRLRPNWIVQELVDAFQASRQDILRLGRDVTVLREDAKQNNRKRKLEVVDTDDEESYIEPSPQKRKTRSHNRVGRGSGGGGVTSTDVHLDGDLIACPICSKRMKEEEVFLHLDVHNEAEDNGDQASMDVATGSWRKVPDIAARSRVQPKMMERLPQLSYSLLNDNALRKKMAVLGLPNGGTRSLLTRRHMEWVNIVNANCDSRTPKSKRELLHELDIWERSQGRQIVNNTGSAMSSVMDKDFDGRAWAAKHDDDFQKLIAEARQKAKSRKEGNSSTEDQNDIGGPDTPGAGGEEITVTQDHNHNPSQNHVTVDSDSTNASHCFSDHPSIGTVMDLDAGV